MAGRLRRDTTLTCGRCGISFLWSMEEQSEAARAGEAEAPRPSRCPGCRTLLGEAGRERGLVKWYNLRRRYGFIVRRNHPDLFAHGSELAGIRQLHSGDLVEFGIKETDRGLAAEEIRLLLPAVEVAEGLGEASGEE